MAEKKGNITGSDSTSAVGTSVTTVDDVVMSALDTLPTGIRAVMGAKNVVSMSDQNEEIEEVFSGTHGLLSTDSSSSSTTTTTILVSSSSSDSSDSDTSSSINVRNITTTFVASVRNYDIDPNYVDSSDEEPGQDSISSNNHYINNRQTDEQVDMADNDGATSGEDEFGDFEGANMNAYVSLGDDVDADDDEEENGEGNSHHTHSHVGFITPEPLFIPSERSGASTSAGGGDSNKLNNNNNTTMVSFTVEEAFPSPKPKPPKPVPRIAPLNDAKIATIKAAMSKLDFSKSRKGGFIGGIAAGRSGLDAFCDQILANRPRYGDEFQGINQEVTKVNSTSTSTLTSVTTTAIATIGDFPINGSINNTDNVTNQPPDENASVTATSATTTTTTAAIHASSCAAEEN